MIGMTARRLLGAMTLAALLAGCGAATAPEATAPGSTAPSAGFLLETPEFSAAFPEEPTMATQDSGIPGVDAVTFTLDGGTFALSLGIIDYPADLPLADPASSLTGARDGAVANIPGATLTSSQMTTVDGRPALDFVATLPGGTYRARILLDDRRLYQILTVGSDDRQAEHEAFAASFRLQ